MAQSAAGQLRIDAWLPLARAQKHLGRRTAGAYLLITVLAVRNMCKPPVFVHDMAENCLGLTAGAHARGPQCHPARPVHWEPVLQPAQLLVDTGAPVTQTCSPGARSRLTRCWSSLCSLQQLTREAPPLRRSTRRTTLGRGGSRRPTAQPTPPPPTLTHRWPLPKAHHRLITVHANSLSDRSNQSINQSIDRSINQSWIDGSMDRSIYLSIFL